MRGIPLSGTAGWACYSKRTEKDNTSAKQDVWRWKTSRFVVDASVVNSSNKREAAPRSVETYLAGS